MPNRVGRSLLPACSVWCTQLGVNDTADAMIELRQAAKLAAPSRGTINRALKGYHFVRRYTAEGIVAIVNFHAPARGFAAVGFNDAITDYNYLSQDIAKRLGDTAIRLEKSGQDPIGDIAVASGYETEVVRAFLQEHLLPERVCRAVGAEVERQLQVTALGKLRPVAESEIDGYTPAGYPVRRELNTKLLLIAQFQQQATAARKVG